VRVRPLLALSIAAVSAVLLAGCSSASAPDATPSETLATDLCGSASDAGAASDAVSATGDIGVAPAVTFAAPLTVDSLQRTVVTAGTGPSIQDGDYVSYALTAVDTTTGQTQETIGYADSPVQPIQITTGSGVDQYFGCATVGSRIVIAQPGNGQNPAEVLVIDVLGVTDPAAWCAAEDPTVPLPTVTFDASGAPQIAIPAGGTPPTAVALETLTEGDGPVVQSGDSVTVNYAGVKWSDGSVFDSSWQRGEPASFTTTGVVAGFQKALEGQKVGSTELVVIPPACGYAGTSNTDLASETLVFVVDIISAEPATSSAQ